MTITQELNQCKSDLSNAMAENEKNSAALLVVAGDLSETQAKLDLAIEESKIRESALNQDIAAKTEEIEGLKAMNEESLKKLHSAEDKLKLSAFEDVVDGQNAVADASVGAADQVDHVAEHKKISDSAEKMAYYRAHKTEIDSAYDRS